MDIKSEAQVKPLTSDDVGAIRKQLLQVNEKVMNTTLRSFKSKFQALISILMKNITDESDLVELDRLKKILRFVPDDELFIRSRDKIWAVRKHIINKDADYFIEKDYSRLIKQDENSSFIYNLIDILRTQYKIASGEEKEMYWTHGRDLIRIIANFIKSVPKIA